MGNVNFLHRKPNIFVGKSFLRILSLLLLYLFFSSLCYDRDLKAALTNHFCGPKDALAYEQHWINRLMCMANTFQWTSMWETTAEKLYEKLG